MDIPNEGDEDLWHLAHSASDEEARANALLAYAMAQPDDHRWRQRLVDVIATEQNWWQSSWHRDLLPRFPDHADFMLPILWKLANSAQNKRIQADSLLAFASIRPSDHRWKDRLASELGSESDWNSYGKYLNILTMFPDQALFMVPRLLELTRHENEYIRGWALEDLRLLVHEFQCDPHQWPQWSEVLRECQTDPDHENREEVRYLLEAAGTYVMSDAELILERECIRSKLLGFLEYRFGSLPQSVKEELTAIDDYTHLERLYADSTQFPDIPSFRAAMASKPFKR